MSLKTYCVKCRAKTESVDVQQVVMKNGRDAISSSCSVCGTKKFAMGKLSAETA